MPRRKPSPLANPVDQRRSRLMGLPVGLRNRIYQYSFQDQKVIPPYKSKDNRKGLMRAPGLLLACKQAHAEAANIYYATATFEFDYFATPLATGNLYRLKTWLKKLGAQRVGIISNVQVRVLGYNTDWWWEGDGVWRIARVAKQALAEAAYYVDKAGSGISFAPGVVKAELLFPSLPVIWSADPQAAAEERIAQLEAEKKVKKA